MAVSDECLISIYKSLTEIVLDTSRLSRCILTKDSHPHMTPGPFTPSRCAQRAPITSRCLGRRRIACSLSPSTKGVAWQQCSKEDIEHRANLVAKVQKPVAAHLFLVHIAPARQDTSSNAGLELRPAQLQQHVHGRRDPSSRSCRRAD